MWRTLIGAAALGLAMQVLAHAEAWAREGMAVIIGNADYGSPLPKAPYAVRDALMMRRQVLTRLGYEPGQVELVTDATRAKLMDALGSPEAPAASLAARVKPGETPVILFYSGHCVPGASDARAYVLPVDGSPDDADATGLAVIDLYRTLLALKPRNLFVVLECGLVADSFGGPLLASPLSALDDALLPPDGTRTIVVAASSAGEVANWDAEAGMGLLTRYLLLGMDGAADSSRLGNNDGRVTLGELQSWLTEEVGFVAKRRYGRTQRPVVIGPPSGVLAVAPSSGWPPRERMDAARAAADRLVRSPDDFDPAPLLIPTAPQATASGTPSTLPSPAGAQPATVPAPAATPEPTPPREIAAPVPIEPTPATETLDSETEPAAVEQGLELTRPQRIAIQEALARIGYVLGPADGSFGPTTRKAITAWQQSSNREPTGYLTAEQLDALSRVQ